MTMTTLPLRRLPRDDDGNSRYLHPNGYVIVAWRRSWSERVGAMRGAALAGPLTGWEVFEHVGSSAKMVGHFHPWARREGHALEHSGTLARGPGVVRRASP